MDERNTQTWHREEIYDELAKNLLCAWIAYRLGVTLPTAKRQVEKALREKGREHPGPAWYHPAEYVEKLQAGYLPLDLSEMQREESEEDLEEPNSWIQ
jgi:hypothetical protein